MFHLVRPRLAQIRLFSTTTEQSIVSLIQEHLKESQVHVEDTSGGCGTMFRIEVESNAFKDLSTVAQHRRVKDILQNEIPKWHGFTLNTRIPANVPKP